MVRTYSSPGLPGKAAPVISLPWWVRYKPSRILFLDDMEGVLKWTQGAGTVSKDSTIDTFEGTNSLKLLTGNVAANTAAAYVYFGFVPASQLMLQCRFHIQGAAATTPRSLDFEVLYYDGTNANQAILRYLKNVTTPQNKWQYSTGGGSFNDIPGGSQSLWSNATFHSFFRMKVDLRPALPLYSLLECDNLSLKLQSLPVYQAASGTQPYMLLRFTATTDTANATSAFIDDVILSDLEP